MFRLLSLAAAIAVVFAASCDLARAADTLSVGFGMADVTPDVKGKKPVYIAGYGMGRRATGVHDPLYARALVLDDGTKKIALVAVDVVGLQYPTVREIRSKLEGFDYVLVASTHNHEGPDVVGIWGASPLRSGVDPQYIADLVAKTVGAVQQADTAKKPVTASYGTADDERLVRDSREPYVKDGTLRAVRFDSHSQNGAAKPHCLLVNWTCHPEALASRNTLITADFPHYTIRDLEKKYGCPVVYFSGAVGGLMAPPRDVYKKADGSLMEDGSFEYAELLGSDVAKLAMKAADSSSPIELVPIKVSARPISVPLDNPLYRVAQVTGLLKRDGVLWTGDPDVIGAPYKPKGRGDLPGKNFLLFGLANDELGYIVPKRQWDAKPPFAYGRKDPQYGEENSCGAEIAPILFNALKRRVAEAK